MTAYWVITLLVTVFVVAFHYWVNVYQGSAPSRRRKLDPEMVELVKAFQALQTMDEPGTDQDEMPGGTGEFGYALTNPIPVDSILSCDLYLNRLRTADNRKVKYERIGSFHSPVSSNPVDGYRVSFNENKNAVLYFSCYQKRISRKTPKNYKW